MTKYKRIKGKYRSEITGHLDITIDDKEEEFEGVVEKWRDVLIHGDPEGLRSFARLLMKLADMNQNEVPEMPIGARNTFIYARALIWVKALSRQLWVDWTLKEPAIFMIAI